MRQFIGFLCSALLCAAACGGPGSDTDIDARPFPADATGPGTPDATGPGTPDAASSCGTCPAGYVCGTANGIDVCRNIDTGVPLFSHVFVILMENTSQDTLVGSTKTPFLHGLLTTAAYSSNYHGVEHPSLPNYFALVTGDTLGVSCDCDPTGGTACNDFICNRLIGTFVDCACPQTGVEHIGDQLDAAGLLWRDYAEDLGTPCNLTTSGQYATRHVPFLYFADVTSDPATCASQVVDHSVFSTDLGTPPAFSFISPNLTHDMHDPFPATSENLTNGDVWLSGEVPMITGSSAYLDRGLLVIVWDEDDGSGIPSPDDPIPMFLLSPLAKHDGYESTVHADHYDLLALFEDGLGLPRLGGASGADPLSDFFPPL